MMEDLVCPISAINELEETCSLQVHQQVRRNSVSTLFGNFALMNHGRSAGRASVPNISISSADKERLKQSSIASNSYKAASNLHTSQSLKSRFKRYQYIRSSTSSTEGVEQSSAILSRLDESFAQIKSQLNNLSEENRTVRTRVHSLTEAVTELCSYFTTKEDKDEEDETDEDNDFILSLPSHGIQRMHSVPPFSNGWSDSDETFEDYENHNRSKDDRRRLSWVKSLERSGETSLVGGRDARVPCIIMVDDSDGTTSEEEDKNEDTATQYVTDENDKNYTEIEQFDIMI